MPHRLIGRTADFGSVSLGSSPSGATSKTIPSESSGFFISGGQIELARIWPEEIKTGRPIGLAVLLGLLMQKVQRSARGGELILLNACLGKVLAGRNKNRQTARSGRFAWAVDAEGPIAAEAE